MIPYELPWDVDTVTTVGGGCYHAYSCMEAVEMDYEITDTSELIFRLNPQHFLN